MEQIYLEKSEPNVVKAETCLSNTKKTNAMQDRPTQRNKKKHVFDIFVLNVSLISANKDILLNYIYFLKHN